MLLMLAISELSRSIKRQLVGLVKPKLDDLINFVKPLTRGYDTDLLAAQANLTENQRIELENEVDKVLNDTGNWMEDDYDDQIQELMTDESFNTVLKFCKENIYFAYKLMNEKSTIQKDLLFIDLHQRDAEPFINMVINVTMKMMGIVFKDVDQDLKPRTRSVKVQLVPGETPVQSEKDIIYPTSKYFLYFYFIYLKIL